MEIIRTFDDIYGHNIAKRELTEIINFLKDPTKYNKMGARLRRGVLLYGPPGTGKTLLARATAGESGVNFIHMAASEFVEIYVGMFLKDINDSFFFVFLIQLCLLFYR